MAIIALLLGYSLTCLLMGLVNYVLGRDPIDTPPREAVLWLCLLATISFCCLYPDAHDSYEDNIAADRTLEIATN